MHNDNLIFMLIEKKLCIGIIIQIGDITFIENRNLNYKVWHDFEIYYNGSIFSGIAFFKDNIWIADFGDHNSQIIISFLYEELENYIRR